MTFLTHHKGFVLAWAFWFAVAVTLMVVTSAVAVFTKRPLPPAPMVAVNGTILPQGERPKTLGELLTDNGDKPANLSAAQWSEIRDVLNLLPDASQNITFIHQY